MPKVSYKSRKTLAAPMLQIGGGKQTASQMRALAVLEKAVMRAIELGRNDVAVEAVKAIVQSGGGGSHYATINSCSFQAG